MSESSSSKATPATGAGSVTAPLQSPPPPLHPALRRLGLEVQGRVDDYLAKVDLELARRGATAAERRAAGVALRNRILEKLAARIPADAKPADVHLHAQDADAALAELGPVEKQASAFVPQRHPARYAGPTKLSRLALIGLLWALCFPMMIALSRVPMEVSPDQPPPQWFTLLQIVVIPLGWSALIAPTVLGLLAIDQFKKSNGRIYGMSLAVFIAALYPLLALDWAVFWICWQIRDSLVEQRAIGDALGKLITQVLPTVACVLGDYFIVAWAWMAVREEK